MVLQIKIEDYEHLPAVERLIAEVGIKLKKIELIADDTNAPHTKSSTIT